MVNIDVDRTAGGNVSSREKLSSKLRVRVQGGRRSRKSLGTEEIHAGAPLISIITVVRNGGKYLEQTIESVINQTYENIEYIIVDGASNDDTLNIIRRYEDDITFWQSERDVGIYDAMNKGCEKASGRYVLFLGAGDRFFNNTSLADVIAQSLVADGYPDLIAAQVMYGFKNKLLGPSWPLNEYALHQHGPAHQGLLVERSVYKRIRYDPYFRIVGDVDFYTKLREQGLFSPRFVRTTLAVFRLGGMSNRITSEFQKQVEYVRHSYKHSGSINIPYFVCGMVFALVKWFVAIMLGIDLYYTLAYPQLVRIRWGYFPSRTSGESLHS